MQKIFTITLFFIYQLVFTHCTLACSYSLLPVYEVELAEFVKRFNSINKTDQFRLETIRFDQKHNKNSSDQLDHLPAPNIHLALTTDVVISQLVPNCAQRGVDSTKKQSQCQKSIQLVSKAYDPVFLLSDFEQKKQCKATRAGEICYYNHHSIDYEIQTKLNGQYIRFTIRPRMNAFTGNLCPY